MEEQEEELPWPGFVDIISSVLLLFIFFVMIMIIIIIFTKKGDLEESTERSAELEKIKQSMEERLSRELERSKTQVDSDITDDRYKNLNPKFQEATEQSFTIQEDKNGNKVFYVVFKAREITLTEETILALTEFIENSESEMLIKAPDNPHNSYISSARNASLARTLNIRNTLIRNDISTKKVSIQYIEPELYNNNYSWVSITQADNKAEDSANDSSSDTNNEPKINSNIGNLPSSETISSEESFR